MFLFSKFVHQTRSLEEGIVFMFTSHNYFIEANFMLGSAFLTFSHGTVTFWRDLSASQCDCISPHVLLITRAGWVSCRFPRADLVFSVAAHTCLVVHSPIGAHPAFPDPRGCHCSHSRPWAGTAGQSGFAWPFSQ